MYNQSQDSTYHILGLARNHLSVKTIHTILLGIMYNHLRTVLTTHWGWPETIWQSKLFTQSSLVLCTTISGQYLPHIGVGQRPFDSQNYSHNPPWYYVGLARNHLTVKTIHTHTILLGIMYNHLRTVLTTHWGWPEAIWQSKLFTQSSLVLCPTISGQYSPHIGVGQRPFCSPNPLHNHLLCCSQHQDSGREKKADTTCKIK